MAGRGFNPGSNLGVLQALQNQGNAMQNLFTSIGNVGLQRRERQEAEHMRQQQLAQQQQLMQDSQRVMESGTPTDMANFMMQYPDQAKSFTDAWKFRNEETRRQNTQSTINALRALDAGDPLGALSTLRDRVEYLNQAGADPRNTLNTMALVAEGDIEKSKRLLEMQLAADLAGRGPEGLKQFLSLRSPLQQGEKPFQMGTGAMSGYVFDPNTGRFNIDPEIQQRLEDKALLDLETKREGQRYLGVSKRQSVNKEVSQLIKQPLEVYRNAQVMRSLQKRGSPSAQIAAVFTFMKALDPTSVVRESEQGMVYSAEGPASGLASYLNYFMGEGRLSPQVFEDLVLTSEALASQALSGARESVSAVLDIYGETLPESFKKRLMKRIPAIGGQKVRGPATAPVATRAEANVAGEKAAQVDTGLKTFTSPSGIQFTIED